MGVGTTGEGRVEDAALGACQADSEDAGAWCEIPAVADSSDETQAGRNRTTHRITNLYKKSHALCSNHVGRAWSKSLFIHASLFPSCKTQSCNVRAAMTRRGQKAAGMRGTA